jgi:hypothetical protein
MYSANLYYIPSLTPLLTNIKLPFNSKAAFSNCFENALLSSLENKNIAAFFYPKMGSIYSSEKSTRVGTDAFTMKSTMGVVSQLPV